MEVASTSAVDVTDLIKVEYECDSTERKVLPTDHVPSTEDYPGPYGFHLRLSQPRQSKSSVFYSRVLNQVFIDMNKMLLVHFEIGKRVRGLFVRALPVYSSPEHSTYPVNRCTVHSAESDPTGSAHAGGVCCCLQYNNVGHVLRAQSLEAQYCYDAVSQRHSVIVPIKEPQPWSRTFAIPFYFTCKTSCPKGMQRRPINVVFTLETAFGLVLGRRVMGVRICSCPKRDMERLERVITTSKTPKLGLYRKRKFSEPSSSHPTDIFSSGIVGDEFTLMKKALLGIEMKINELDKLVDNL